MNVVNTFKEMEYLDEKKLIRAKLRVDEIKNFYKHIVTYILVNLFLTFVWKFSFKIFGDFVVSNHFDDDGFTHIPIWFIWGVFLAADVINTFGFTSKYGRDWEERKINEFMKE
ncbi:2TM domain-containing protein [Polaribacter sp. Hel1_85]|uniref:2TM domain-containing protein n=1 Tax=Polaribacter sp. Hel1_85 TaxID=1250005 RepID=UPI00056C3379|nr:2TM domain-containing protein [Polaribacter sp. Hel1_85]